MIVRIIFGIVCFSSLLLGNEDNIFLQVWKKPVLDKTFQLLLEETTAGYVLYGNKPMYLGSVPELNMAIPGTEKHAFAVTTRAGMRAITKLPRAASRSPYSIVFNKNDLLIINRNAFLKVVNENLLLFQNAFGVDMTAQKLLSKLVDDHEEFSSLFTGLPALQGVVLGYGVNNAITYEQILKIKEKLQREDSISLPYQLSKAPEDDVEILKGIKNSGNVAIYNKAKSFFGYSARRSHGQIKVPFSFIENSNETTKILHDYQKSQKKISQLIKSHSFTDSIAKKLHITTDDSKENVLAFSPLEKSMLPKIVARSLATTFYEEMSISFIKGMKQADKGLSSPPRVESFENIKERVLSSSTIRKKSASNHAYINEVAKRENTICLIPGKLCYETVKEGCGPLLNKEACGKQSIAFLIQDRNKKPLAGSFDLDPDKELDIQKTIPGLAHAVVGMKEGEVRNVYIHPELAYGIFSDFGNGEVLHIQCKLVRHCNESNKGILPFLQPKITTCEQYTKLQEGYFTESGYKAWMHYKQASDMISLESVLRSFSEIDLERFEPLSQSEEALLLKLEWYILYSKSGFTGQNRGDDDSDAA